MSDMVEDVQIFKDGAHVNRKFLYMTNQQVARFDSTNIQKILDAFQLPETNFVIQLLPSYGGIEEQKAHEEKIGLAKYCDEIPPHKTPRDAVSTETQTMLFIKHCILPVAMKARALIIITATNDCSLSVAVGKIMGPIQKRMGSKCPVSLDEDLFECFVSCSYLI